MQVMKKERTRQLSLLSGQLFAVCRVCREEGCPIVGSTFQLTGRHDLIGSSRSVEIFAASQAVRLPAVELTSFLNFTTRHPVSRVVNSN